MLNKPRRLSIFTHLSHKRTFSLSHPRHGFPPFHPSSQAPRPQEAATTTPGALHQEDGRQDEEQGARHQGLEAPEWWHGAGAAVLCVVVWGRVGWLVLAEEARLSMPGPGTKEIVPRCSTLGLPVLLGEECGG